MVISPSLSSPCDCEALPVIAGTEGGGGAGMEMESIPMTDKSSFYFCFLLFKQCTGSINIANGSGSLGPSNYESGNGNKYMEIIYQTGSK